MALKVPRLDDRAYEDLVEEARARIPLYTPEWTDHSPSDPGITLIELFAYMTDIILYRLNRVPDKNFVKFMQLMGMDLHEAVPAQTKVTFWLSAPQNMPITIPGDIEVSTTRTETEPAIVFTTDADMEVQVPDLSYLTGSYEDEEGNRFFNTYNVSGIQAGFEDVPVFASETPKVDDALYFGFDQNLSNHLLGFEFEVDSAEGAGIDPNNPPYVWEVLSTGVDNEWYPIEVDIDETLGLNQAGLVRVHVPDMRLSIRNDINAHWLRLRYDYGETDSRYEISPRLRSLAVTSWGGTVSATNVTRVYNEVLGRSEGTPGQKFYIENTPIATRTRAEHLIVRLEDGREQQWEEVSDFSTSRANDRHYTIDSETGEVRLGPALPQPDGSVKRYGAMPPKGAMLLMNTYRYGGGMEGNLASSSINVLRTTIPYVDTVLNRFPAEGGRNAESMDNAKMRVPGHLRSLQRAVTAKDFEYLAQESAPGKIGRVYCLQPPLTNRGENKILIIPFIPVLRGYIAPESLELADDVRDSVQQFLDERRLLSTKLEVTTPVYRWVETEVRLQVSQHYEFEKVRRAVEARLFEFINPLTGGVEGQGWPFGRDLLTGDVIAALQNVEGVDFIRSVKLYPISYQARQFRRETEVTEIAVPSDGLVVSYQHTIVPD
ncbi:MAG: putative baseplate assembly protein [Chloroflexota bacterium]